MNEYTLKDSSQFAKDITNQSSNCFMASLDVDPLFNNVPLDETINICIDELFKSKVKGYLRYKMITSRNVSSEA